MTPKSKSSKSGEIVIATLGLLGVLVTGTLSNWDKLFGTVVEAKYSGYRPTGTFETEFRYYFDVSGARQTIESMQRQLLLRVKEDLLSKHPGDAAEINSLLEAVEKESPKLDDVFRVMMPLYQKHFTLAEIQELNKFYSTEVMQDMVKKQPLLTQDAAPIQIKMMNDFMERLMQRLQDSPIFQ